MSNPVMASLRGQPPRRSRIAQARYGGGAIARLLMGADALGAKSLRLNLMNVSKRGASSQAALASFGHTGRPGMPAMMKGERSENQIGNASKDLVGPIAGGGGHRRSRPAAPGSNSLGNKANAPVSGLVPGAPLLDKQIPAKVGI